MTQRDICKSRIRPPVPGVDPVVRQLYDAVMVSPLTCTEIQMKSGVRWHGVAKWFRGEVGPSMASLLAVLNTIGMTLAVIPEKDG